MQKMLMGIMVFVCIACVPAQDRTEYLLEHGWGVQNIDLVPLPDHPITFRALPERDQATLLVKGRWFALDRYTTYYDNTNENIRLSLAQFDNPSRYEFRNNGQSVIFYNLNAGYFSGSQRRAENSQDLDEPDFSGFWYTQDQELQTEYRYLEGEWDYVLRISDGYMPFWPQGTHLVRWVDENTMETDGTFGPDALTIEVIRDQRNGDDEFWLRMISPIENPTNDFEGDLILRPVLHPDQWSESMRDFP